ncbi:MAG: Gfo/Idh/MocA family oxidoreductase [Ruminococcaceae bacterium]|nr:Gfo/Idh/MocA family oxidoreductase [Oscillospiraceae bacterium]
MEQKLIVGVIGLGFGRSHMQAAMAYGAEIAAVCDTNVERLNARCDENNIPVQVRCTDWHEVVNNDRINVVIIASPDRLHREMAVACLEAGKHVLCEKPLALTRDDMDAIIAATKKTDAKCMVGQICRFTPAFVKAKELIDAGEIGELFYVESEYAHDYEKMLRSTPNHWRTDPLRHGVVGGGCHAVDLLRWIAGDPTEVVAYGVHKMLPMVPYDDTTISLLKFPNDVIGKVFVSTGCKRNYTMRSLFYGTRGTIICDNTSDHMQLFKIGEDGMCVNENPEIIPIDINNHNTQHEFRVFAEHIINDTPVKMSAEEGAKSVEVCLSIVRSAEIGQAVKPDYNF